MKSEVSPVHPMNKGLVIKSRVDDRNIIWCLVPELPDVPARATFPWLTVVSWKYDGSNNAGMPSDEVSTSMAALELMLGQVEADCGIEEAYRRIGNDLREFAYYVPDQQAFLAAINERLSELPRLPIEIKFFHDPEWSDFSGLIDDLVHV